MKDGAQGQLQDAITGMSPPEGAAGRYWAYYAPILRDRRLWTASSRDVLRNYVEPLALPDRLQGETAKAPLTFVVTTVDGARQERESLKVHPLLSQLRAVRLECRQQANDLCLPPAAAVRTPSAEDGRDAEDPWKGREARLLRLAPSVERRSR